MALPKKGSRRICVDGINYRWRLRGRPTYDQGMVWSHLTYAVEHAETPGTTLLITTNQPHPSNWMGETATPVLPSDVANNIRTARANGWSPETHGSPFHLNQPEGFTSSD
ncbi:hypothetical protein [Streptomyces sp. NBC_00829]|uniref:hypothetical protein n=1 Tax=Streptomyces sp. NBC_00829 TaxID=2903679 RepID=UPI002F91A843|nr:hypothetical protein OG293_40670 [Streptomyces sp. NBC_00829]